MAADKGAMTISLLGREFRVGVPDGQEKELAAAVEYLNRKLKEVRDTGKVAGNERIAIMAALNIAHELVSNQGKSPSGAENATIRRRIVAMQETLDSALVADQENLF